VKADAKTQADNRTRAQGAEQAQRAQIEQQLQSDAPSRIHVPTHDGTAGRTSSNVHGTDTNKSWDGSAGNGRTTKGTTSTRTDNSISGDRSTQVEREARAQNQKGNSVHSLSESTTVQNRKTGQSLGESTRLSQDSSGRESARTTETESAERTAKEKAGDFAKNNTSATAVLGETKVGDRNKFHGVATVDKRMTQDKTGAGYQAQALAVAGEAGAGATADLKNGQVHVGANAIGRADLVGVAGRAQVGSTKSVAGAGFVEGEAHIGARAQGNIGATLDARNGTAKVGAGVEGFAGGEIRGTGGFENRYGGLSVTARGQAGIGGAAGVEGGLDKGRVKGRADLGATLGLGGRVTVDANVNVQNVVKDAATVAPYVAPAAYQAARTGYQAGKFVHDNPELVKTAAGVAARSAWDSAFPGAGSLRRAFGW
jgi:hypothetical protein